VFCYGATTLSMMTLNITTLSIMTFIKTTLSKMTLSMMTLGIVCLFVTLSMMTLSIKSLFVTLSMKHTQHSTTNNRYAECCYPECGIFNCHTGVFMLTLVMLTRFMLIVVILNVSFNMFSLRSIIFFSNSKLIRANAKLEWNVCISQTRQLIIYM
jgi:hypothetical protein